jgi:hypothetical protein
MNAAALLSMLRNAGATISSGRGRLIVEAPPGVLTAAVREDLAKHKAAVLALLGATPKNTDEDPILHEAFREITNFLVVAYRRYAAVSRVGQDRISDSPPKLAISSGESVHGVVS